MISTYVKSDDVLLARVRPGHLDGILYCLRTAVGKEEPAQALGADFQQPIQ